jgi:hypothetical protein
MKFDLVILLAVLAFCLIIFFPIFSKNPTIPTRFRSFKRRKLLFGQLMVIVLLIATLATLAWPIRGVDSLLQGGLLCLVVLVPVFVLNLLVSLHYRSTNSDATDTAESGTEAWFSHGEDFFTDAEKNEKNNPTDVNKPKGFSSKGAANAPIDFGIDSMSNSHLSAEPYTSDELDTNELSRAPEGQKEAARSLKRLGDAAALSGIPRPYSDAVKDSGPAVDEQLDRVSLVNQSQDLGIQGTIAQPTGEPSKLPVMIKSRTPQFNRMIPAAANTANSANTANLETIAISEMSGLVTSLTIDNERLQKLVIAQKAVIESQSELNNQIREVARDAIKSVRDAQSNQKMAEKIARREKIERQRIQIEHQNVTSVLENAMSTISVNREPSFMSDGV